MSVQNYLLILFSVIVIGFMVVDLGFLNRKSHRVEFKQALWQSLFWVGISLVFALLIFLYLDKGMAAEFLSAYLTEKMLSVDNLFVMMLIFSYFKLDDRYHHKALFWGILGAIVFRGIFIGLGSFLIHQFHWILYIFGAILIYTAIKLLTDKKTEEIDFNRNKVLMWAHKYLPISKAPHEGKFFQRVGGKFYFTSLFLVVLLIEVSDIIFAFDSIPAVFAISQNLFIVFTSNIFAVMGLRALFFLIENVLNRFHHLQIGLSFILFFIGAKLISGFFGLYLSSLISFSIIISVLLITIATSLIFPKKA